MIENFSAANFLLTSSLLLTFLNLFIPLIKFTNQNFKNILMIVISIFFLLNIIIINESFSTGIKFELNLFAIDKFTFSLNLEPLGLIFLNLIAVLWIIALLYSISYLSINNISHQGKLLFFLNLSVILGIFIALSSNLFTMFICYEFLTLATLPLVSHGVSKENNEKIKRYFKILMISSMMLFFPAIIIIYAKAGHGDFIKNGFLRDFFSYKESIILLLMFIFGISKTALFPLHRWLTAAMVASYPVSALLHAVIVVKSGLFCTIKILDSVFGLDYLNYLFSQGNWLLIFPIVTIFYSSIKALKADNIKIILAYSTINQLAITLLASFMFTQKALLSSMLHLVSHAFTKICLFYAAGIFYTAKKTVLVQDLRGIAYQMPFTSLMFLIGSLSLVGIPPFGGFFGKVYIVLEAARNGYLSVIITVTLSSILSALYMLKFFIIFNKPDSSAINIPRTMEMNIATFICASGIIFYIFFGFQYIYITRSELYIQAIKQLGIIIFSLICLKFIKNIPFLLNIASMMAKFLKFNKDKKYIEPIFSKDFITHTFSKLAQWHDQRIAIFAILLLIICLSIFIKII